MTEPKRQRPRSKNGTNRVPATAKVQQSNRDEVDALAAELGESRSDFIRRAIALEVARLRKARGKT